MSKRRVRTRLEAVSDEVLGELSPADRTGLLLEVCAEGTETQQARLVDTCPMYRYRATDLEFRDRIVHAQWVLLTAVYNLHTTVLRYELAMAGGQPPTAEEDPGPPLDDVQQLVANIGQLRESLVLLYAYYHGYRRFAEEVLGIDIETLFKLHPDGPAVLEAVVAHLHVADEVSDEESSDEHVGAPLADVRVPWTDDEEIPLTEVAEYVYEQRRDRWEAAFGVTSP